MNRTYSLMLLVLLGAVASVHAEMRTWSSKSGKTIEGEYVSLAFENVTIKTSTGEMLKLPVDQLSDDDRNYVEIINPPELTIDYRESTQPKEFVADSWTSNHGGTEVNHPIYIINASFGALIKQKSTKEYKHDLTIEMYILTEQYLDPDKYRIIAKVKSAPFRLTKENDFRYVYTTPQKFTIIYYNLYSTWKRGEKPGTYLILVRDEQGKIIAHRGRNNWLINSLDKLEALPVGAWINDKGVRVHPTQPPRTRRDNR